MEEFELTAHISSVIELVTLLSPLSIGGLISLG
jgi:hypothetical protein